MSNANISDPEVLKRFRQQFVKFDADCRQALGSVRGDIYRVIDWLQREQLSHWQRQLRKREELVMQARLEYQRAASGEKFHGKSSGVDERKILDRMMRLKEEAELRIERVKHWSWAVDQETGKLMHPCAALGRLLDHQSPQTIARLDRMIDSLDDYLRAQGTSTGGAE